MVVRDRKDQSSVLFSQEDHAELSAQFAAHWGNDVYAKLRPYHSIVFATTYHDSGFGEWEGQPPINAEKGRPYGHRELPFSLRYLEAHERNVEWVKAQDPYAGLIVSMHRTGLWQNRYQTIASPKEGSRSGPRKPEIQAVIDRLEESQKREKLALGNGDPSFADDLWFNYRMLQVFDILSLYFCLDGYDDDRLKEYIISLVPIAYGEKDEGEIRIVPTGPNRVKFDPYPFDASPLRVSARARIMATEQQPAEEKCREAYHKADRFLVSFEIAR